VTEVKESLVIGAVEETTASTTTVTNVAEAPTVSAATLAAEAKAAEAKAAEIYIASTIAAENSNLNHAYATTESKGYGNFDTNFVAKGTAKVPSGTGIYTYDEYKDSFRKEASSVVSEPYTPASNNYIINTTAVSEPYTIPDPVYSNTNRTYASAPTTSVSVASPSSNLIMGTSYKVQLITVEYHNPNNRRYDGVRNLGLDLKTEYIEGKGWTRVLLGSFASKAEAEAVLDNARSNGFARAFVVKYQDGQRKKRLR